MQPQYTPVLRQVSFGYDMPADDSLTFRSLSGWVLDRRWTPTVTPRVAPAHR
jgi:hypothetical protein